MLVGACAVDGNELSRRQGRLDDFITRAQSSRLGWLTVHSSLSLSLSVSPRRVNRSFPFSVRHRNRVFAVRPNERERESSVNKKLD